MCCPTLDWGWTPGPAAGLQGCGHGESGGCSCQSPHCLYPAAPTSAARLGPSAQAAQPAPRGSGSGPVGLGWGLTSGLPCLLGSPGAAPDLAGLGTGCEGQGAASWRPGHLLSASGWAAPSGDQCLSRHCGHQGGHSGLKRLRSRCPRNSVESGDGAEAGPGL